MSGFAHGQRVAKGDRWVCADCGQTVGWLRKAFNYKRLREEKYFQTPEGRAAIEMIHRRYPDDSRVRDWLLKLAKNGTLVVSPTWQTDINLLAEGESSGDPYIVEQANERLDGQRPDIVLWRTDKNDENGHPEPVQPGIVIGLGQMLDQGYKGKGVDLMNMTFDEVEALYEDWEQTHKRDPDAGQVVHAYPDGWTVRRLEDRDQAFKEGAEMRNCVPQYAPSIDDGEAHVFSLRDELNRPHANVLISPRSTGGHWEGGTVRDIRGKANSTPMDKYADYLRDWFFTFNEKPTWSPNPGPPGDPGPGSSERYGLGDSLSVRASITEDWLFESSWQVESNWNRVRNQLRHNNQFDESTELMWDYLKALYGHRIHPETKEVIENNKNDKMADWLVREIRNRNIKMPQFFTMVKNRIGLSKESLADYQEYAQALERDIREIQTGVLPPDVDDYDQLNAILEEKRDELTTYKRYIENTENKLRRDTDAIKDPKKVQENAALDPDETYPQIEIPNTKNYNGEYLTAAVTQDWLDAMQTVVKGRQDKAKALRKNPTAYEDKIAEIREQMRGLSPDDEAHEKLNEKLEDYQKRIDDAQNSDLNTLEAPSIAEEVQREAWMRRLAQDGGKVLHTFPDGKTVRWINNRDVAKLEGEIMGHCIGDQYANQCANGRSINLSVRDKRGMPHATFEVVPKRKPTIYWQRFLNDVAENPEKYENLTLDDDVGQPIRTRDAIDFNRPIGTPIMNLNGEQALDNNGEPLHEGDYVYAEPTDMTAAIRGWITHDGEDGIGVHREDGREGGGPGESWSKHELLRDDHETVIRKEKPASPASDDVDANQILEQVQKRIGRWMEGGDEYRDWDAQDLADRDPTLVEALIASDSYMPAIEGSHAHQVQGKGNKVPEQRYHKYLRDYFDTFSDEDRPLSVWSSYFTPKPVQYVDHLADLEKGVDELGAKVEGERGIDWDALVHSANEGRPEMKGDMHNKHFVPIDSAALEYDPQKGQKIFDAAQQYGAARDLFKSINNFESKDVTDDDISNIEDWEHLIDLHGDDGANEEITRRYHENESSHYDYTDRYEVGGEGDYPGFYEPAIGHHMVWGQCNNCGQDSWLRDDRDGELLHVQCPDGHQYIQNEDLYSAVSSLPTPPPRMQRGGPQYTPYQAAMVQHLGPQLEQYFRTQAPAADYQWALHGAPKQMNLKCPSCGSAEIRPCNQCQPADHYICDNCGAMINMPGGQGHQSKISEGIEGCPYNHGRRKRIHIGSNGDLCACLYHPNAHIGGRITKQADKLNDFLRSPQNRPDLQTPEGQYLLDYLEQRGYATEDTDVMLPWLVREWKKGRVTGRPESGDAVEGFAVGNWLKTYDPEWVEANKSNFATQSRANVGLHMQATDPKRYRALQNLPKGADGYLGVHHPGEDGGWVGLTPGDFRHWGDWYSSNHPTRRQVQDLMGVQAHELSNVVDKWDEDLSDRYGKPAYEKGKAIHKFPDDWSVQHLNSKRQLEEEGEIMDHCIGGYWQEVRDKGKMVFSLRDGNNRPHATWAIDPTGAYCSNCNERHTLRSDEAADKGIWPRRGVPKHKQRNLRPNYLTCKNCEQPMQLIPHRGSIEQLQGYDNEMPSSEALDHIREYMGGLNGPESDERPRWSTRMDVPEGWSFVHEHPDDGGYREFHPADYNLQPPPKYDDRDKVWRQIQEELPTFYDDVDPSEMNNIAKNIMAHSTAIFGDATWIIPYLQQYESDERGSLDVTWEEFETALQEWQGTEVQVDDKDRRLAEGRAMAHLNHYYGVGFGRQWSKSHPDAFAEMVDTLAYQLAGEDKQRARTLLERAAETLGFQTYEEAQELGSYQRLSEAGYYGMLYKRGKPWSWSRSDPKRMIDVLMRHIERAPTKQSNVIGAHENFRTGEPCHCKFTIHLEDDPAAHVKLADKMNDFLMNPTARPDLQTPEAQEFLGMLQEKYHTPQTDALMPWLTREWKKNRVQPYRGNLSYVWGTQDDPRANTAPQTLSPDDLNHWADWYHSDHPSRQGIDIMQMQTGDMHQKILDWEESMAQEAGGAAIHRGQVAHEWPDGWTVQRLEGQRPLAEEGKLLGHCIGGYHQRVRDGDHIVYSLRDKDNNPQCSWAIVADRDKDYCPNCKERVAPYKPETPEPDEDGWTKVPGPRPTQCPDCGGDTIKMPHDGEMEQIQAKNNTAPTSEMQSRIRDWVKARFNDGSAGADDDRPHWNQDVEINDYDQLDGGYTEYHPGDYGLEEPERWMEWPDILHSMDFDYGSPDPSVLLDAAKEVGGKEDLRAALDSWWQGVYSDAESEYYEHWSADEVMDTLGYSSEDFPCSECKGTGVKEEECFGCGGDGEYDGETCERCQGEGKEEGECPYCEEGFDHERAKEELYEDWFEHERADQGEFYHDLSRKLNERSSSKAQPIPCQACGDLTENGFCPRCDWGGVEAEWPEAKPLPSVKRDIAEGFQASTKPYDWALDA